MAPTYISSGTWAQRRNKTELLSNRVQGRTKVIIRKRDNRRFMVEMQFGINMSWVFLEDSYSFRCFVEPTHTITSRLAIEILAPIRDVISSFVSVCCVPCKAATTDIYSNVVRRCINAKYNKLYMEWAVERRISSRVSCAFSGDCASRCATRIDIHRQYSHRWSQVPAVFSGLWLFVVVSVSCRPVWQVWRQRGRFVGLLWTRRPGGVLPILRYTCLYVPRKYPCFWPFFSLSLSEEIFFIFSL